MAEISVQLKVAEAGPRDVGRGIARIDPEVMEKLGITDPGEVIALRGKRETVAKVMPTFPEFRGRGLVQIDGIIRENAQVGIDEKVKLSKIKVEPARKVTLSPLTLTAGGLTDSAYLSRQLSAIPVVAGDRVQASFLGTRKQDFRVVDTVPSGAVLLTPQTTIAITGEGKAVEARLTYEDIGGLGEQIKRIREMIELPLRFPQVFARLGVEPPKGVLLHGPPGCGKTLIARVIANETDAYFLQLSGPQIMHKFYGQSEKHLRDIFAEAKKNAPAILFLDELDAIAPKREELGGEKQVERRIVATLLAEMDGLESRGEVIVIGASVTGDTPIFVKNKGLMKIAELIDLFYKTNEEGRKPVNGLEVLGYEPQGNDPRHEARRFASAKFQLVRAVFRHKVDEICEIEFTGKHRIRVTADHSLFVRGHGGVKPVRASDLRVGDMLVGLPYSSYMFGRFTRPVIFDSVVPNIPFSSPLEKETAHLFGLWLAEGCIGANKRIDFCLSVKERNLIDRVKTWAKRLGRKPYNHPTRLGGAVNTGFTYAGLARFITENFGKGAKNKQLPSWVFTLPDHLFLSLLSGWAAGDGWNGKDGRVEITTTSHQLAVGMLWACRMHNIWASMQTYHYDGFGKGIAYRLKVSMANNPWNDSQSERWPKRVQPRVISIRRVPFDGYVYDLCGCAGEAFYGGEMPILLHNTNLPNILDPALRRPGRFDREITIPIPDKNGRLEILTIHTRGMPLADDVNLEKLAFLTHGFVGADSAALCREAAMYALRRLMPKIDFEHEVIPQEALLSLEVTMDDFLNALREIEPSAIREVFTEIPEVTFKDIGGLEDIKRLLTETICEPLYHPEVYAKAKTKPAKGILLTGEPGTGKTLLAKAIAKEAEVNFISVKGPELLSRYIGESERGVREVFKKAKQAAPCILFFDEIEALVPKRGKLMGEQVTERVISQFLTEMDGIEELKGVVILASTNRPDLLDPALLRPGRFDFVLELPKPDQEAREEIFKIHTKGKPLSKDVSLASLASQTKGLVGADIASICQKASLLAIREFLQSKEKDLKKLKITKKHFIKALRDVKTTNH